MSAPTVILRKAEHAPVRFDCSTQELDPMPLWWDDASYIAYQAFDGPTGEYVYELGWRPGDGPVVKRWRDFEFDFGPMPSRAMRRAMDRFAAQIDRLVADGAADRAVLDESIPF